MTLKAAHPFPARMAPEIATKWLKAIPPGARVLDPMCGSGVVLRQSIQLGHNAAGFDVDPLAVLMSRVWTKKGSNEQLAETARLIGIRASKRRATYLSLPHIKKCAETRAFIDYWFAKKQQDELSRLMLAIQEEELGQPTWLIDGLKIALSRTIITKHAGASLAWDVSHSRPHKKRSTNDYETIDGFVRSARMLAQALDENKLLKSATVKLGDCRNLSEIKKESIDIIVTSPPYLNAIDYLRGHKLSLVWLGFTIPELRSIRATSIGTERAALHKKLPNGELKSLNEFVAEIRSLPTRQQNIVLQYAKDAVLSVSEMKRVLKPKAKLTLVLADSYIKGVQIRSSSIFEWAGIMNNMTLVDREVREIAPDRRYLPINSADSALQKRMKVETIQTFKKSN